MDAVFVARYTPCYYTCNGCGSSDVTVVPSMA